jgi:hypothetical protein
MAMEGAEYRPASSVTSLRSAPVSTLRTETTAAAMPAPDSSRTVPEMEAPTT